VGLTVKCCLVVGLSLDPASGVVAEDPLAALVEHEDEDGEGYRHEPPVDLQRVHLQALVHARGVGQEGCQAGLKDETKVEDLMKDQISFFFKCAKPLF